MVARGITARRPGGRNSRQGFLRGLDRAIRGDLTRVMMDRGRQFESHLLFKQLNDLTGTTHLKTTAYHLQANGMERFHRQLTAAIKCQRNERWTEVLPAVLLGVRAAWKDDVQATATPKKNKNKAYVLYSLLIDDITTVDLLSIAQFAVYIPRDKS